MIYNITKHLKYLLFSLRLGFLNITIFRTNYWFIVFFETLISIAHIVLIEVIYGSIETLAGWSKYELYVLYGTFQLQAQLASLAYIAGVDSFRNRIISGSLDMLIVKPMNTQFLSTFTAMALNKLFPMIPAVYMVFRGLSQLNITLTLPKILIYLLLFTNGILMQTVFASTIMALSFWFINNSSLSRMLSMINTYSQHPREIFGPVLSVIFTFILPITLYVNPGVSALIRKFDTTLILLAVLMLCVTFAISRLVWKLGLLKYQSASS